MSKLAIVLCILAAALSRAGRAGSAEFELRVALRPEAETAGEYVRLAEVAELSGPAADEAGRVLLGPAPEGRARRTIDQRRVARRLTEECFDARRFHVTGAPEVVVARTGLKEQLAESKAPPAAASTKGNSLTATVAGWVSDSLAERLSCPAEKLEVKVSALRGIPPAGILPAGAKASVKWPTGRIRLGRQRVNIEVTADGESLANLNAQVEAVARLEVLVAIRNLEKGDLLLPEDVRSAELRLTDLGAEYLFDARGLVGVCAARSIRAGAPIEQAMVTKQTLVHRGQTVTVFAESGAVRVSQRATAKSDGGLDDQVTIELADGRGRLSGRVVGSAAVKVE